MWARIANAIKSGDGATGSIFGTTINKYVPWWFDLLCSRT
ncbi:hypothetical protein [Aeromonas phage 65.2]|uniref:Uncharacterized protein n=1 Tax=Aeromonas phage 65.2 TaxID=1932896 RepID=A0A219YC49_9CAUD|nr:hypothetical protein [Aeromonas phage 65.2]